MSNERLDDVFGVARDLPKNYVVRDSVDQQLVDALARDQHIVIYGSSKQGKTCLRKYNLQPHEYVIVTCSNKCKPTTTGWIGGRSGPGCVSALQAVHRLALLDGFLDSDIEQ